MNRIRQDPALVVYSDTQAAQVEQIEKQIVNICLTISGLPIEYHKKEWMCV